MKEFIEKLNEKLTYLLNNFGEHCEEWGSDKEGDCHRKSCSDCVLTHAIEIVNQLAEEYKREHIVDLCNQFCDKADEILQKKNNGWIPCSERLPELETDVFICTKQNGIAIASLSKPDIFWTDEEGFHILDVIAWQPLPQAYQPKGE